MVGGFKFNPLFLGTKYELLFNLGQRSEELCAGILKLNKKRAEEKKIPLSIVDLLPFFDYVEKTGSRTEPDNPKQTRIENWQVLHERDLKVQLLFFIIFVLIR